MQNGGQRNSQGRDMSQRIEVCRAGSIAHPQPFLTCGFEARIVALTLCTQGVCSLETEAAAVNGKPVIRGDDPVFNATPVFLPVIPVFVVTRANTGLNGQQNFCRVRLLSVVLPSLCIASPASQIKLPAGRALLLELRFLRGIKASPS